MRTLCSVKGTQALLNVLNRVCCYHTPKVGRTKSKALERRQNKGAALRAQRTFGWYIHKDAATFSIC